MDWNDYARVPELADFRIVETDGWRMLVRSEHITHAQLVIGGRAERLHHDTVGGGRQAHPVLQLPGGPRVVVRVYRRGGAMRHVNRSRYFLGHRAFEELRAMECARRAGVRVPTAVAAAERAIMIGYEAVLSTLWIPGARDAASWLFEVASADQTAVLHEVGCQIARMHDAGVAHPDLNLRNLLIVCPAGTTEGPVVYLIDFDRARLFSGAVPSNRRARDIRRLARSARKLAVPLGSQEWRAMREGYGSAWPLRDLG